MTNIPILKIKSDQNPILISRNAKQEILPISKFDVIRNINSIPIKTKQNVKFKIIIETKDNVDISSLNKSSVFKIYSIVKLKQPNTTSLPPEFVEDSLEKCEDYVTFRPILNALLINFSCKTDSSGSQLWKLEFEEL